MNTRVQRIPFNKKNIAVSFFLTQKIRLFKIYFLSLANKNTNKRE